MGRGEERDYVEDKVVVRHLICVKKTVYFTRFERYSLFCLVGVKLGSALITPPVYHHHPHPPPLAHFTPFPVKELKAMFIQLTSKERDLICP